MLRRSFCLGQTVYEKSLPVSPAFRQTHFHSYSEYKIQELKQTSDFLATQLLHGNNIIS